MLQDIHHVRRVETRVGTRVDNIMYKRSLEDLFTKNKINKKRRLLLCFIVNLRAYNIIIFKLLQEMSGQQPHEAENNTKQIILASVTAS